MLYTPLLLLSETDQRRFGDAHVIIEGSTTIIMHSGHLCGQISNIGIVGYAPVRNMDVMLLLSMQFANFMAGIYFSPLLLHFSAFHNYSGTAFRD